MQLSCCIRASRGNIVDHISIGIRIAPHGASPHQIEATTECVVTESVSILALRFCGKSSMVAKIAIASVQLLDVAPDAILCQEVSADMFRAEQAVLADRQLYCGRHHDEDCVLATALSGSGGGRDK